MFSCFSLYNTIQGNNIVDYCRIEDIFLIDTQFKRIIVKYDKRIIKYTPRS